ncbi:arylesterase [Thiopseudomonas acetoxidans]|uniref:Arylesterase n=1 Tax=Thiopseudomonas acetoxidans TaxID=3041622 RepID=A0ABT7SPF6_9GAMM|nr:arylesterase [Thiopseudomonas sp. CY1220]MDM7858075.1 arylesterase [Thiopseudomonas sp. CY1220]NLC10179.1 arylesterase [Gammaproteobacteria bacterium]
MRKLHLLIFTWLLFWVVPSVYGQTILVVGDSISAAYGLEIERGWVALLQQRLTERGLSYQVVNASISGDTSAGGRNRLPALLEQHQPSLVLIELGGNDGLRGLPLSNLQDNLRAMVQLAKQQEAQVMLLGMRIPPNYGTRYTEEFYQVFQHVAELESVLVVDFFLEGVGGVPGMVQADGIHPTEQAQAILLDNAWPILEKAIDLVR